MVGAAWPHGMPFGPPFPFPPVSDSQSLKGPERALTAALSVLKMEINQTHGGEGLRGGLSSLKGFKGCGTLTPHNLHASVAFVVDVSFLRSHVERWLVRSLCI